MWEGGCDGGLGGCGLDIVRGLGRGRWDGEGGRGGDAGERYAGLGYRLAYGVEAIQMQIGVSIVHSPHAPVVFHPLFHAMQCLAMVHASRLFLFDESRFCQSMSIKSFSVRVYRGSGGKGAVSMGVGELCEILETIRGKYWITSASV